MSNHLFIIFSFCKMICGLSRSCKDHILTLQKLLTQSYRLFSWINPRNLDWSKLPVGAKTIRKLYPGIRYQSFIVKTGGVLGIIQRGSAFILELFNSFVNDPDDGMESALIKSAGDNKLQEAQEQDWNSKWRWHIREMVGKNMMKFIRDSCKV